MAELPLLRRFPALARLPRAPFGNFPTAISEITIGDGRTLLVKRDDLSGAVIGGNKVRGLEWLLGIAGPRDLVITVGPRGSTHALATAMYAKRLGASTIVVRWPQEMNPAARRVAERLRTEARVIDAPLLPIAYAIAAALRVHPFERWIPAGGLSPSAMLGHVNAALELVEQLSEHGMPARVFVPLGTGGTAAGLALGFRIANVRVEVVAVRVVPKILGRERRIRRLAASAARLIEHMTGERLPRLHPRDVHVLHTHYGGAYGRPVSAIGAEGALERIGVRLDDTYSRKTFAAAASDPGDRNLFWLTFDGRLVTGG